MTLRQLVIAAGGISPQARESSLVWVLGSGTGSNLKALLDDAAGCSDYRVAGLITDRQCGCESVAERYGLFHQRVLREAGMDRGAFDQRLVDTLSSHRVDLLVLAGYKRLLGPTLLQSYRDRIINVHPGDLVAQDAAGQRRYTGLDAVSKALAAGERRTRSCVIHVTEAMDEGAIVVSGPWVSMQGGESAQAHQLRQKAASDWPALCQAVRLLSSGCAQIHEGRVFINGHPAGPAGYEMQEHNQGEQQCVGS